MNTTDYYPCLPNASDYYWYCSSLLMTTFYDTYCLCAAEVEPTAIGAITEAANAEAAIVFGLPLNTSTLNATSYCLCCHC